MRARGILKDPEWFDAAFFGMNPKEAEVTDPQQRAFLEAVWTALEDAGCDPARYPGSIGVYAGMSNNTYYLNNLHGRRDLTADGWVAHHHDGQRKRLSGDARCLQTELARSGDQCLYRLLHFACRRGASLRRVDSTSLRRGARGWRLDNLSAKPRLPVSGRRHHFARRPLSRVRCGRTGTVFSSGLGVVVLKRLQDAVAEGDQIYAVIRGAALNNDGSSKVSFTAPSVDGHSEVIALAQALAGVEPESISYIETHGTGTPIGDPIELAGLTAAFRAGTTKKNFCAIGSVKANIGHLDAAAGVAGLIKTTLALKHKQLPPSLHFTEPNPKLNLADSPFFVNTALTEWRNGNGPLRAGVSSFGVGGTNAHVIVEEAPVAEPSGPSRPWQLLLLSSAEPRRAGSRDREFAAALRSAFGFEPR